MTKNCKSQEYYWTRVYNFVINNSVLQKIREINVTIFKKKSLNWFKEIDQSTELYMTELETLTNTSGQTI